MAFRRSKVLCGNCVKAKTERKIKEKKDTSEFGENDSTTAQNWGKLQKSVPHPNRKKKETTE